MTEPMTDESQSLNDQLIAEAGELAEEFLIDEIADYVNALKKVYPRRAWRGTGKARQRARKKARRVIQAARTCAELVYWRHCGIEAAELGPKDMAAQREEREPDTQINARGAP